MVTKEQEIPDNVQVIENLPNGNVRVYEIKDYGTDPANGLTTIIVGESEIVETELV